MRRSFPPAVLLLGCLTSVACACLWDTDTLRMERERAPSVVEAITGKFLRHSREFYEWRIQDRTAKLKTDPQRVEWYDDLAVSHHKLGDHKKAIEVIRQKDAIRPGLYETEANLGTFLLFDGQWDEAIVHVRKALEINPDAHFGREKYQALLIEWVLPRLKNGTPQLPLSHVKDGKHGDISSSFREFLRIKSAKSTQFRGPINRSEAIGAVVGMMRFAEYRSPVLLEALASLLVPDGPPLGEQRLAARAYLAAAAIVDDEQARTQYRAYANNVLASQEGGGRRKIEEVAADLQSETAEADAWFAELRAREIQWIREGKDPEAEFWKHYPEEPTTTLAIGEYVRPSTIGQRIALLLALVGAGLTAIVIVFVLLLRRLRSKRATAAEIHSPT